MNEKTNDLNEIITQTISEIKLELGEKFNSDKINLAELERRTGFSRAKLRRLKGNGFIDMPHDRTGLKGDKTVLTGFTGVINQCTAHQGHHEFIVNGR